MNERLNITPNLNIIKRIKHERGIDLSRCYQCGKCTAGCPLAIFMDYSPNQAIRFLQLNLPNVILKSKTIWLCVSCQTCSVRCPKMIDLHQVMNYLRLISQKEKIKPAEKNILLFHKIFEKIVRRNGRLFELGLIGKYNLCSMNPFKDVFKGLIMMLKGKISFLPKKVKV